MWSEGKGTEKPRAPVHQKIKRVGMKSVRHCNPELVTNSVHLF